MSYVVDAQKNGNIETFKLPPFSQKLEGSSVFVQCSSCRVCCLYNFYGWARDDPMGYETSA